MKNNPVSNEEKKQRERRRKLMDEVLENIRATRSGFRAADNLSREELYDRRRS